MRIGKENSGKQDGGIRKHRTHVSADEYKHRAKGTKKQVREIGRRLRIRVIE